MANSSDQKSKSKKQVNSAKNRPSYLSKMTRNMWLMFFICLVGAVLFFLAVAMSNLPDTEELENPKFEYATKIYTSDDKELGRYFRKNRDWVSHDELNPHLVNALVATEDERFYNHIGIDYKGTARAVIRLGKDGGASTITQQLARLLFHEKAKSFIPRVLQKFKEWIIAIRIEKRYTKEEIISMYLNKFDFINDSDGVAAAAITYFGKNQADLEIDEAAVLIGMLKNPWMYNPKRKPEKSKLGRNVVLKQMLRNEIITQEEYDEYRQRPLDMSRFQRQEDSEGLAPYFRTELTKWVKQLLKQDEYKKPDGSYYNIYTDGLKIYTSIDSRMQRHAEAAVRKNMKQVQKRYFQVWKNKDPWTYKADEKQEKIRKDALNRLIQQSARYGFIKDRYMSKIFGDIERNIQDARLRNIDIIRMLKQEKNKAYFADIVDLKWASKSQIAVYKTIMASEYWSDLKKEWRKMEKEVRKEFNTERSMKVYDYETNGYKTVRMTPLDSIKFHRQHMQSGMLAIDPSTGYVKAWVGGINHRVFQYDHVNSNRQVGSTFKPFVYGTAISVQGVSPCWEVDDIQYSIAANDANFKLLKKWEPANSNNKFSGEPLTLYEALKKSKNSVSVYLMKELGDPGAVIDLASTMGIPRKKIPSVPSICLGTPELSLMDMTSAYSTFANNGIHNSPNFVTRIETRDGQLIYNAVPEQHMAMSSNYNFVMVGMLKYAAQFIASKFKSEIGGKTGTTNDYVDGWFMGITPNLVVGTWVGGEDPWIRFLRIEDGQGGVMARPTFVEFLQRLESDPSLNFDTEVRFQQPEGFDIETNCNIYDDEKKKDAEKRFLEDALDDELFDEEG